MTRTRLQRVLIGLGLLIGLAAVGLAVLVAVTVWGLAPIPDGEEVAPGVHVVADAHTSLAIIELGEGAGVALIDCGMDPTAATTRASLASRGYSETDVRIILLTHGHVDHVQGCAAFPNAAVLGLAAEAELVAGRVASTSPVGRLMGASPTGVELTRALADGERVGLGDGRSAQVFAVPGHTEGSAAYLVGDTLFLGDSADGREDGGLQAAAWIFSEDSDRNRASLRALEAQLTGAALPVATIVLSHSGPVRGPLRAPP